MKYLILILINILACNSVAYAYIDPGFIAGFFNLIVASLASLAVIFIFKPYYFIKNFFKNIFKKSSTENNKEDKDKN